MKEWYYEVLGEPYGPVDALMLRRLVDGGVIRPSTLLWREGFERWVSARRVLWIQFLARRFLVLPRGMPELAWISLGCHIVSLVGFLGSGAYTAYWTSPWWMGLGVTSGFLLFSLLMFEIDYSLTPTWVMPRLAAAYSIGAACWFLKLFHDVTSAMAIPMAVWGALFLVAWLAAGARGLLWIYPQRRTSLLLRNITFAAVLMAGVVLMNKYVIERDMASLHTVVETAMLAGFIAVNLAGRFAD